MVWFLKTLIERKTQEQIVHLSSELPVLCIYLLANLTRQ